MEKQERAEGEHVASPALLEDAFCEGPQEIESGSEELVVHALESFQQLARVPGAALGVRGIPRCWRGGFEQAARAARGREASSRESRAKRLRASEVGAQDRVGRDQVALGTPPAGASGGRIGPKLLVHDRPEQLARRGQPRSLARQLEARQLPGELPQLARIETPQHCSPCDAARTFGSVSPAQELLPQLLSKRVEQRALVDGEILIHPRLGGELAQQARAVAVDRPDVGPCDLRQQAFRPLRERRRRDATRQVRVGAIGLEPLVDGDGRRIRVRQRR